MSPERKGFFTRSPEADVDAYYSGWFHQSILETGHSDMEGYYARYPERLISRDEAEARGDCVGWFDAGVEGARKFFRGRRSSGSRDTADSYENPLNRPSQGILPSDAVLEEKFGIPRSVREMAEYQSRNPHPGIEDD